jgi:uncharacterized protein
MSSLALAQAIWGVAATAWFLAGLYVYWALIRQITLRPGPVGEGPTKRFGIPEAFIAALLMSLLLINLVGGRPPTAEQLTTQDLINNFILTGAVVFVLIAFLTFRGFNLDVIAGLSKVGTLRAIATAAMLLLMAFPFILTVETVVQRFAGHGSSRQEIVEMFSGSANIRQRILIIILAVAVAPATEELIFRFFLYGVLKRYFGMVVGLLINALLFAAVHQHLPSLAPLFVLGVCFTLAYEWSGSLLVPIAMHSLFNAFNLVWLALPDSFQQ